MLVGCGLPMLGQVGYVEKDGFDSPASQPWKIIMGRAPTTESHGSPGRCKMGNAVLLCLFALSPRLPVLCSTGIRAGAGVPGCGVGTWYGTVRGAKSREPWQLGIFQKSTCWDGRDLARSTAVDVRRRPACVIRVVAFGQQKKSPTVSTVWRSHETCRDQIDLRQLPLGLTLDRDDCTRGFSTVLPDSHPGTSPVLPVRQARTNALIENTCADRITSCQLAMLLAHFSSFSLTSQADDASRTKRKRPSS